MQVLWLRATSDNVSFCKLPALILKELPAAARWDFGLPMNPGVHHGAVYPVLSDLSGPWGGLLRPLATL